MADPALPTAVVLSPGPGRHAHLEPLAAAEGIALRFVDSTLDLDAIATACKDIPVIIVAGACPHALELARRLPELRLLQTFTAGTDWLDVAGLATLGVRVADNNGANAVAVAEHTVALMLSLYHHLERQFSSARQGTWQEGLSGRTFRTLENKRVGLVGLGRIGSRVARRLSGWECEIVYHDIAEFSSAYEREVGARRLSFDSLLATADVVSVHVPLNRNTRHLLSDEHFARMRESAVLVNTCRGPVIDEEALVRALRAGAIAGAGLDVTETEPLPLTSPLLHMDNVVITPHLAARAVESGEKGTRHVIANAARLLRGEEPVAVVRPV